MEPDRRFWQMAFSVLAFILAMPATVSAETVPDLVGRHLSEIEAMPEVADVALEIQKVDSTTRQGEVLLQIPGGGSEIGTRRRIYLKVSNGVLVPDLHGRKKSEAETKLTVAGIGLAVTQRPFARVRKNLVAAQFPKAGTRIDASRQIIFLVVSKGTKIPNLVGLTHVKALNRLHRLGLNGRIEPPGFESHRGVLCNPGLRVYSTRVTEHEPKAATLVQPGTNVTIYYKSVFIGSERQTCSNGILR